MTSTSPRRSTGRLATALLALVTLVAIALLPPAAAGAARAATADPPTLTLKSQSGWVAPTGTFHITIGTTPLPPGAKLLASLYNRVLTQSALDRTGEGDSLFGRLAQVTVPLDAAPVAAGTIDLSFPVVNGGQTPPYGFNIGREGVYPLGLVIQSAEGDEIGQLFTHLVRLPEAGYTKTALTVALVVPVSAPVAHQPDGSVDLDPDQQAALQQVVTTLSQEPAVPLTLEPTPETVSALSESDLSNNTTVVKTLSAASLGRQVVSGPSVAVDSGAWVGQGLSDVFDRELTFGATQLKALFGFDPDTRTTVVDSTTTPEVLSALVATQVGSGIVPSGRLEPLSKNRPDVPLTQTFDLMSSNDDRIRSVAADDDLAARLVKGDDRVLSAHEVLASLSLLAFSPASGGCVLGGAQCSRGLALQLPASAADAQVPLSVLLQAFADRNGTGSAGLPGDGVPVVSPMTVDSLLSVVDPASESGRTRADVPVQTRDLTPVTSPSLGTYPAHLRTTLGHVDGFRSMVTGATVTPTSGTAPATDVGTGGLDLVASLDQVTLASGSAAFDEQTRQDYLDGAESRIHDQLAQITTQPKVIFTLTSRDGTIPLSINNGLDYPVLVRIGLKSDKLDFPGGAVQNDVLLPAGTPTRVDIRVKARASGAFKLDTTITSPDGNLVIATSQFNVRSTAVSGVGLVLTIAAGLFLLLWWGRHFRRTRRAKRLIASDHPSTRTAEDTASSDADSGTASSGTANGSGSGPGAISYAPADKE